MQRRWTILQKLSLCAAVLLGGPGRCSLAQTTGLGQGIAAELQTLASHASTIFVGQISSTERKGSIVEVTFRVEQPVAGGTAAKCVVREWAGLWPPGQSRYRVGERVLGFFHGTSTAGLSSPVHGAEGLVPVVVQGVNAPRLLDVRRVAAAVVRSPKTPLPTEEDGGMLFSDALDLISSQIKGTGSAPVALPLPTHGRKPVGVPPSGNPNYPVVIPVSPQPRGPLKMPVSMGGGVELR